MMRTDDFIFALSQDAQTRPVRAIWFYAALSAVVLLVWTLLLYLNSGMGVRSDFFKAITDPMVAAKQVVPIFLVLALFPYVNVLRYPEVQVSNVMFAPVVLFFLLMVFLFSLGWISTPPTLRGEYIQGTSQMKCLFTIPIYSWVVTAFVFYAVKSSAPTNPAMIAFLIALFSSALATVVYAIGCTEDSPLFYGLWYSVAMLFASLVGGVIGAKYLKW